jgi:hypothetical protein
MASIITATTTSGLTQSADNSGVLQLASGTGNLVTVPSVTGTAMVSGNMPAFAAYQSTAQSLSNAVNTKITFTTEEFDTNSNFASSTFTPTVAGYYQINSVIGINGTAGNNYIILLFKNGSEFKRGNQIAVNPAGITCLVLSCLVYANGTTDTFDIYGYQNSSLSQNTVNNAAQTYFNGSMVRGA